MAARKISLSDYQKPEPTISADALAVIQAVPPHEEKIEVAVLAPCLFESDAFKKIKRLINKKDFFYYEKYQTVYEALRLLDEGNRKIDLITVQDQIKKMGLLGKVMSDEELDAMPKRKRDRYLKFAIHISDLLDITNRVSSSAHIQEHAKLLHELYMRRVGMNYGFKLLKEAQNMEENIYHLYDDVRKKCQVANPSSLLVMKQMNEVMDEGEQCPRSKWIMGNLVKESEIVVLYGDEGTGKSILAFQMCDKASKGRDLFPHEDFKNECESKLTIFYDFELEEAELYDRYSRDKEKYNFHENFMRSSIDKEFLEFENADELIIQEIQRDIEIHSPQFVVIDNITYIASESQDPAMATKIMKRLLALQKRSRPLSIIVIAHTPKRDMSMPIESRHLAGAKNLANFAKSLIAVSLSKKDPDKRYIKHVKCRNGRKMHGAENVIECVIVKEGANLKYEFYGFSTEMEHLEIKDFSDKESDIMDAIVEERQRGESFRKISKILEDTFDVSWSHTTIQRKLRNWNKTENIHNEQVNDQPDEPETDQEIRVTVS